MYYSFYFVFYFFYHLLFFYFQKSSEDDTIPDIDETFDDESCSSSLVAWRSPLCVRLVAVFVFTQFVIHRINVAQGAAAWVASLFPGWENIPVGKIIQIVIINVTFFTHLLTSGTSDDW